MKQIGIIMSKVYKTMHRQQLRGMLPVLYANGCDVLVFTITEEFYDPYTREGELDLLRMIRSFPPDIPRESLDYMLNTAPRHVLANKDLPHIHRSDLRRRRYDGNVEYHLKPQVKAYASRKEHPEAVRRP